MMRSLPTSNRRLRPGKVIKGNSLLVEIWRWGSLALRWFLHALSMARMLKRFKLMEIQSSPLPDIPFAPYTVPVTLISDGEFPLVLHSATVTTSGSYYTPSGGTAVISASSCPSSITPGSTCTLTILYHVRTVRCTTSPYGLGYTGIDLTVLTDAPVPANWTERFTITGMPICNDN